MDLLGTACAGALSALFAEPVQAVAKNWERASRERKDNREGRVRTGTDSTAIGANDTRCAAIAAIFLSAI
jgi:hypothetical protein